MQDADVLEVAGSDKLAGLLAARLTANAEHLKALFGTPSTGNVRCCWLDDVMPEDVVTAAYSTLPKLSSMVRRENRKERKFVCANLDALTPPIRDLIKAFSQQSVADAVAGIIGKPRLGPDPRLYNGGITTMVPGDFMCPHLDNSHDYGGLRRREVVMLYYFSPSWMPDYGGYLELWGQEPGSRPKAVDFKTNRLVIMETTDHSWHSIRPVTGPMPRVSLTTYLYAPEGERSQRRLTRFASWPGEPIRGAMFSGEFHMRSLAARFIKRRVANQHIYQPGKATGSAAQPQSSEDRV